VTADGSKIPATTPVTTPGLGVVSAVAAVAALLLAARRTRRGRP
jgi:hypothetical protein